MITKIKDFLLINRTERQTVAKNTFWLTVSNVGGRLIRSIIIIYAARVLGASEWGAFSYAISLVALITIFTDLGIGPTLTREASKKIEDERYLTRLLSTSLYIKIALLLLGVLAMIFIAPSFTSLPKVDVILPIITLVLIFDTLREFGVAIIRAMEKMEMEAALYIFTNIAILICGTLFLMYHPTVRGFSLAYAIGTGAGMVATIYILRKRFEGLFNSFDWKLTKIIFISALPFAISSVLGGLMINTDILMLGFFRSAEEVGYYSATQRLIQLLYLFPTIFASSVFPLFSRFANQDEKKFRDLMERILSFNFLLAIPIVTGGIILAEPIIQTIFGTEYLPAVLSLQILLATLIVTFSAAILTNAVFAHNRQNSLVIFATFGVVSNAVLDFFFIQWWGINGSAIATLIAQILSNMYLWHTMKRINPFHITSRLPRILVAGLIMTLVTVFFHSLGLNFILNIVISALVYGGLLFVLREPLFRELKITLQPLA
ncbi:MAG: flippase [Patescibacteria group bacterium]